MPIIFLLLLYALLPRDVVSAEMMLLLVFTTSLIYIVRSLVLTVPFIGLPARVVTFLNLDIGRWNHLELIASSPLRRFLFITMR